MAEFEEALAAAMAELGVGSTVRQGLLTNDLTRLADFADITEEDLVQGGLAKIAAKKLLGKVLPRAHELSATGVRAGHAAADAGGTPNAPPVPPRSHNPPHGGRPETEADSATYTLLHRPADAPPRHSAPDTAAAPPVPPRGQPRPAAAVEAHAAADPLYAEPTPAAFEITGCETAKYNGEYFELPSVEIDDRLAADVAEFCEGAGHFIHGSKEVVCYAEELCGVPGAWDADGCSAWCLRSIAAPGHLPNSDYIRSITDADHGRGASTHWPVRWLPLVGGWFVDKGGGRDDTPSQLRVTIRADYLASKGLERDHAEYVEERRTRDARP